MSKGKKHKRRKGGGRPVVAPSLPEMLDELAGHVETLAGAEEDAAVGPEWGVVHKLLLKTPADRGELGGIVARRDVEALRGLVEGLARADAGAGSESPADGGEGGDGAADADGGAPDAAPGHGFSNEALRHAMRAFKKRLKLAKLDQESKLGGRYTTGGRTSNISGILPPRDHPAEIWDALVAEGRLRSAGAGFYELVEG